MSDRPASAGGRGPDPGGLLPPSTLRQVGLLTRYQFRDYLRSSRFILMFGIVAVIGAVITAGFGYYRPAGLIADSGLFYSNLWGGLAPVVIVLGAVIFGGDAIAGEFQNRTGYFLMGLPIRRVTVYAGKFLAALAAAFAALLLYAALILANGVYYLGSGAFTVDLLISFLLSAVYLLAVLGTTFFFSSLFKTSTYATLLTAVLFLFGFSILQTVVSDLVKIEPWFIISYASAVIGNVFIHPYPSHFTSGGGFTAGYNPSIPEAVAIMLAYFLITSIVGLLLFEREEFS